MASPSASANGRWNYDVFLNFRGDDTRKIFVGHLHKALDQKAVNAFIDSEDLRKGNHLSDLLKAIDDSRLSILVFSQNYASSTWCLKELVQILHCMATKKQLVVPVFYEVDPSDIRKLKGSFAEAFAKHEQDSNADMEEIQRWKSALTEATNLSGWDSRNYKDDAKFIEKIVEDISKKLVYISSNRVNDLVGMDSHIAKMSTLLCLGEDDVRVVGVYGMPGIGKTTIARAVYDQLVCQFEHHCFLENVKEGFKNNGAIHMQEELLSRIFDNRVCSLGTLSRGSKIIMERLSKKKVLLVLDDVENFAQIEALLGKQYSFGSGSRIIVTTRDIQSLSGVDARYSPMFLSDDEARELFMQYAFRTNKPTREYDPLSRRAVEYARGLPLALKVLGAFLDNKSIREWEDELEKLEEIPHIEIQGVLRTSFDGLDPTQKDIFLDIVCFFRGMNKSYVTNILEGCGFYPHSGLRVLFDRALVTVSDDNRLEMHDLIQDMGWEIIRQQSIKEPGKRSRLWIYEDVAHVLTQNTATDAVEGIMLDLSKSKDVYIDAEAFVRLTKLRLLRIGYNHTIDFNAKDSPSEQLHYPRGECKQHVRGDVNYLSHDLRYLMWYGCPLKSLPFNFHPKNLVDLDMRYSHIEQLWEGTKPFKKLKFINLSHSHYLTTTPDFTEATNLETLVLEGCLSLLDVNSSISALKNLVFLCLKGCKELKSLPSRICLKSLKTLDLSGCSSLEKFPEISGIMEDLSELYLNETAIEDLPSSIERLQGLVLLNLRNCRSLVRLPDNICNLSHLTDLTLSGCSKLYHMPENMGSLESLMNLEVEGSGIRELPFSMLSLNKLKRLSCDGCKEMMKPFSSWSSSAEKYCSYSGLLHLDLSDCNLLELSDGIAHLSSLKTLELRRNNLESLPATMNQLRRLIRLELEGCKRLKSVPELSSSISYIDANDCKALENVAKPKPRFSMNLCFIFSNCLQLIQTNLFRDIVETHSHYQGKYLRPLSFNMSLPGSKIPDWFNYQCKGFSVTVQLPPNWFDDKFLGLAICAVSDFKGDNNDASDLSALCYCTFKGNHGEYSFKFTLLDWGFTRDSRFLESDHMFLAYVPWSEYRLIEEGKPVNERFYTEATFEIVVENGVYINDLRTVTQLHCITSFGVRFFHGSFMEVQNLSITESKSHHDSCEIIFATTSSSRKRRREREWVAVQSPAGEESSVGQESWMGERSSAGQGAISSFSSIATGESGTNEQESHEDPMFIRSEKVLKRWSLQATVSSAGLPELYDDGFSWRNYGQKEILGEKYPRPHLQIGSSSGVRGFQLHFINKLPSTIFTGSRVESEDGTPLQIVLRDASTRNVVSSGSLSSVKIEVLVLNSEFGSDDQEDWTEKEFSDCLVREREGKPLVTGELTMNLRDGECSLGDIVFTDNSTWIKSRKFRLAARVVPKSPGDDVRVREAASEPFVVKDDHRGELCKKHYPPRLSDEIWRLEKIAKDGAFHKRLSDHGINFVGDLLQSYFKDQSLLRNWFGSISTQTWCTIIDHAMTCETDDHKLYAYHGAELTLLFNSIYKFVGAIIEDQFCFPDQLTPPQKALVENLKQQAYINVQSMVLVDGSAVFGLSRPLPSLPAEPFNSPNSDLQQTGFQLTHQDEPAMQLGFNFIPYQVEGSNQFMVSLTPTSHPMQVFPPVLHNSFSMEEFSPIHFNGEDTWSLSALTAHLGTTENLFQVQTSTWSPINTFLGGQGGFCFASSNETETGNSGFVHKSGTRKKPKAFWCKLRAVLKWWVVTRGARFAGILHRL